MAEGLAGSLAGLASGFAEGAAALGSLGLPDYGPGDIIGQMEALREQATGALAAPVKFMSITPFQHTVGTRKGEYGYLTPGQALSTLAGRFAEAGSAEGEESALVALLITAPTPGLMGEALEAFNRVYPIAELEQACRRAKALATLETDKFIIPEAPAFPPWTAISPQKNRTGQAVAKALGGMVAAGEGAAMGAAAPGAMLAAFAQKQAAKLARKAADLSSLASSMAGGMDAWRGVYVQGRGSALFRHLSELAPPFDASFKCTSLLCFSGTPGQTAYYRESFGLCPRRLTHPTCLTCPGRHALIRKEECPF